jgi:hypothetical protein
MPFTQAIKTISRWGSGSKDLVAALEGEEIWPQRIRVEGRDGGELNVPS